MNSPGANDPNDMTAMQRDLLSAARQARDAAAPPLSDAQRQELRARLSHHRAHPDDPGVTLDDIRRKLLAR